MKKNTSANKKKQEESFVLNLIPVIVNHKDNDVELTKDNVSSIYNTNYINSFIDKVGEKIDNDITLDIEIMSKYMIFTEYKLQSLQRKINSIKKKDSNDKVSELMSMLSEEEVEELLKKKK